MNRARSRRRRSSLALAAPARADFSSCVASLRADASAKGVSAATLDAAFDGLQPDMKVLEFETNQPEFKTPIWDYMAGLVDDERVADGKAAMAKNAGALAKAEQRFGVDRHVLAAIWGVESNFGEDMGKRPLVQSLSTLACFELAAARLFSRRADGDAEDRRSRRHPARQARPARGRAPSARRSSCPRPSCGSRSISTARGATSSNSPPPRSARPPIISRKSGWRTGEPWGFEVKLPDGYSGPSGRKAKQPMSAWAARGITRVDGRPLGEGEAGLLLPAGADGPAFLVTHNFDVIYSYNAAESYTLAIAILAQRLAGGPGIVTPWPTDDPGLSRAERRELQTLLDQARLRRRRPRRRDRRQDQGGDRRFRGQERADGGRAGVDEGAGGVEAVNVRAGGGHCARSTLAADPPRSFPPRGRRRPLLQQGPDEGDRAIGRRKTPVFRQAMAR